MWQSSTKGLYLENNYIKSIANLLSSKDKDVQDKIFKLYNQKEKLRKRK